MSHKILSGNHNLNCIDVKIHSIDLENIKKIIIVLFPKPHYHYSDIFDIFTYKYQILMH